MKNRYSAFLLPMTFLFIQGCSADSKPYLEGSLDPAIRTEDLLSRMTLEEKVGQMVQFSSPSNIALVKYWGKKNNQIPQNPSISFTLSESLTTTSVEFKPKKNKVNSVIFEFYGIKDHEFGQKIKLFISNIEKYFSFLKNHDINIKSENNFPHSSGIASSASSMSALASCLVDIEKINSNEKDDSYYLKKKSFIARLGSGSASRSIEGPITLWGESKSFPGSSDLYAINTVSYTHLTLPTICSV